MEKSIIEPEGLYNPTLRFAFTNIRDDDFTSYWGGVPITVKAGETIEISNVTPIPGAGHALALKMTKEMVDNIMISGFKAQEAAQKDPYYRAPDGLSLGIRAVREPIEDKILRLLDPDEESPAIQVLRKQIRAEIESGGTEKASVEPVHIPTSITEFADITQKPVAEAKAPAKVKKLKKNETPVTA